MLDAELAAPLPEGVREVWWIRHGQTAWNREERIQGDVDIPLDEWGEAQALALAPRLAGVRFDGAYASDLSRAARTAELALGVAPTLDRRLRELAYGALEGKSWSDMPEALLQIARHWREDPVNRRLPDGGESYADLAERVGSFLQELPASGRFVVVAHGGTVRSALYRHVGALHGEAEFRVGIQNTSITRLREEPRGKVVVTLNDHAHLSGLRVPEPA